VTPPVTVVVPTRDRPAGLRRCLAALRAQDLPGLEIVVADDGSRDAAAVAAAVAATPGARLVRTGGRGPAAARNAGAAAARAPVVCFTDDDCAPEPGWAAALAAALDAGADAAVGRARPPREHGPGAAAWQVICDHLTLASRRDAGAGVGFGPSCTLACRAAVAAAVPFDERFERAAGEDRDLCARLTAAGHRLVLAPAAVVVHHHELGLRAFWRQQVNYGRGALRFRATHRRAPEPPGFYARLLVRGLRRGPAVGALVALAQLATAAGMLLEARRR
jgi:glycosyltransferase involved in cell wall biosynthesis